MAGIGCSVSSNTRMSNFLHTCYLSITEPALNRWVGVKNLGHKQGFLTPPKVNMQTREASSILIVVERFLNALHKPGPVFNYVAAGAFHDGADYIYRVRCARTHACSNENTTSRLAYSLGAVTHFIIHGSQLHCISRCKKKARKGAFQGRSFQLKIFF